MLKETIEQDSSIISDEHLDAVSGGVTQEEISQKARDAIGALKDNATEKTQLQIPPMTEITLDISKSLKNEILGG